MSIHIGLCAGRHPIVRNNGENVNEFVFPKAVENPLDFKEHRGHVESFLKLFDWEETTGAEIKTLCLYVTGLTPLLTAFLHEWSDKKVDEWGNYLRGKHSNYQLYLMHYNRDTEQYEAEYWRQGI